MQQVNNLQNEEKEEPQPTKEETQKIGETFVQNYVSCLFVIIAQFKNALRLGGTPLPPNTYAVIASKNVGKFVGAGAAFALGGSVGVGAGATFGGEVLSYGMKCLLGRKQKKKAKKLIKLITSEDSVTPLDEQAQKAQDNFELKTFTRAGTEIFEMYECQIVSVQRLAEEGCGLGNLLKLAVEAAKRSFNYLLEISNKKGITTFISDMLVDGVIDGKSDGILESLFHLGKQIKTKRDKILVKNIFEEVGVILNKDVQSIHSKRATSHEHGYRWPAPYELKLLEQTLEFYKNKAKPTWEYLINKEIKESIILQVKERFEKEAKPKEEKIIEHFNKVMSSKSWKVEPKNFNVRNPVSPCAARTKEVDSLLVWFNQKKGPVLIYAMGGQGKSELCRQFIQKLLQEGNPLLVTWFIGETFAKLFESVSEFAEELGISKKDSDDKQLTLCSVIKKISKKINGQYEWVVIIDNVDAFYPKEFKDAFGSFQQSSFVVVTSRKSNTLISSHRIELKELDVKAAHEFVKSSIIHPIQEDKWVKKLCTDLQNYALPLHQSVAMINHKQCVGDGSYGIQNFLELLEDNMQSALSKHMDNTDYDIKTFNVFDATIKELNESEIILLSILSLVNPDGIKKDFLKKLYDMVGNFDLFQESLETLKTLSLIGVNSGVVSIHRVVQKIVQDKFKSDRLEKWNEVWSNLINKLDIETLDKEEIDNLMRIWESKSQTLVKNYSKIS